MAARRLWIFRSVRVLLLVVALAAALLWGTGSMHVAGSKPGPSWASLLTGPGGVALYVYNTPGNATITPHARARLDWWEGRNGSMWLPRVERWATGDWWIAMPHWLTIGLCLAGAWGVSRKLRAARDPMRCGCGYPLEGLRGDGDGVACPECGRWNARLTAGRGGPP